MTEVEEAHNPTNLQIPFNGTHPLSPTSSIVCLISFGDWLRRDCLANEARVIFQSELTACSSGEKGSIKVIFCRSSFDVRAFFLVTLRELPLSTLDVMLSRVREVSLLFLPPPYPHEIEQKDSCMCWIANRNCEARLVTPLFASVSAGDNEMKPFQCASTSREAFLRGYFENSTSAILVR